MCKNTAASGMGVYVPVVQDAAAFIVRDRPLRGCHTRQKFQNPWLRPTDRPTCIQNRDSGTVNKHSLVDGLMRNELRLLQKQQHLAQLETHTPVPLAAVFLHANLYFVFNLCKRRSRYLQIIVFHLTQTGLEWCISKPARSIYRGCVGVSQNRVTISRAYLLGYSCLYFQSLPLY